MASTSASSVLDSAPRCRSGSTGTPVAMNELQSPSGTAKTEDQSRFSLRCCALAIVFLIAGSSFAADPKPLEFHLTYDSAAFEGPFTGRVFVLLSQRNPGELPSSISWS